MASTQTFTEYAESIFSEFDSEFERWNNGERAGSAYLRGNPAALHRATIEYAELKEAVQLFEKSRALAIDMPPELLAKLDMKAGNSLRTAMESIVNYPETPAYHIEWFKDADKNIKVIKSITDKLIVAEAAELKPAQAAVLMAEEGTAAAASEAAIAAESYAANQILKVLRAGVVTTAAITIAELIVAVKEWMDSLPDTARKAPELVALQKYTDEHGPHHANAHQTEQYLQQAEPQRQ